MPSKKPTIIFVADEELVNRLDDFQFGSRIRTRSEAIRQLIEAGLKKYEKKHKKKQ